MSVHVVVDRCEPVKHICIISETGRLYKTVGFVIVCFGAWVLEVVSKSRLPVTCAVSVVLLCLGLFVLGMV